MSIPRKTGKRKISPRTRRGAGLRLIILGTVLIFIFGIYRIYSLNILSFGRPTASTVSTGPAPIKIDIPQVNLHLPVTEAIVTDGTWEISPDGASHWDNSANPGQSGNIVIYGHNKTNLFGPIRWLNLGEEIILTAADGQEYRYRITETVTVPPSQIDYVQPKDEEVLTLYTCTGLFDSQRYVVIAKPIGNIYPPNNR